jgi:5-methylcytosine-specific restriction endonuclease McrA
VTGLRDMEMRSPCPACGKTAGLVEERNGQDTVRCAACNRFCYNAPRVETGRAVRSVTTIHNGIKPGQRFDILQRDGFACVLCKNDTKRLHAGHLISVEVGLRFGLTDAEINDDENLIAICEECNLGQREQPIPLRLAIAILRARISWAKRNERKA